MKGRRASDASRIEAGDSLDYFPTPPWLGRALGEVLMRLALPIDGPCWEPACGEGHLVHGLRDVFGVVWGSDVHDYGRGFGQRDFLDDVEPGLTRFDRAAWIVSNPPFGVRTAAFIRKAVERADVGVAMLLQLRLLEGVGRHRLFRECGLYASAVVPRKGSGMRKGLWQPRLSSAATYGWFIFVRPGVVPGWAGFDGEARQLWIDPDAADRLTREGDAAFAGLLGPDNCQGRRPVRQPQGLAA